MLLNKIKKVLLELIFNGIIWVLKRKDDKDKNAN